MHAEHHAGGFADLRERYEILECVVWQFRVQRRVRRVRTRRYQVGIAIRRASRDELGAYDAVRARPVVDDDLLLQWCHRCAGR